MSCVYNIMEGTGSLHSLASLRRLMTYLVYLSGMRRRVAKELGENTTWMSTEYSSWLCVRAPQSPIISFSDIKDLDPGCDIENILWVPYT